jgi:hypothetical protein
VKRLLVGLIAAAAFAPAARADYAVLRNGQRLHVYGYEQLGPTTRLRVAGGTVDMPADEIVRFDPEEIFAPRPEPEQSVNLSVPYAELIRQAAKKYSLDAALLASVIKAESNFDARAISRKNAQGLMQLMPSTSSKLAVRNPFDPAQNIEAGARYLRELLVRYKGNVSLALAAYNAGPDRVTQYNGVPPFRETRNYIQRVTTSAAKNAAAAAPTTSAARNKNENY